MKAQGVVERCTGLCPCASFEHDPKLVVLTGGPGAGKTAVLELAKRTLCEHVAVLPEAAGIVFGGGFPRRDTGPARRGAQRAIFHVQREMERILLEEREVAIVLCDRGSLDGAAYWPGTISEYLSDLGVDIMSELSRYQAVVHLRTPSANSGYDHSNPLRIETAQMAQAIDGRIGQAWVEHPHRRVIAANADFATKAKQALAAIARELPECCKVEVS